MVTRALIVLLVVSYQLVLSESKQNTTTKRTGNKELPKTLTPKIRYKMSCEVPFFLENATFFSKLQLWRHPDTINRHVDIFISETSYSAFQQICSKIQIDYEIIQQNIFDHIEEETSMKNIELFDSYYQQYKEIVGELKRLAAIYSDYVSLENIGKSYEKRDIYVIKIHGNSTSSKDKPIMFLNCGSHAREWLGVSACKYLIRRAVFDQHYNKDLQYLFTNYQLYILPVHNPDGYVFTHQGRRYRLWRKSRSETSEPHCRGVDINRNFDYRWGGGGSSPDPCEDIYCGVKPFSENEPRAMSRFLYKHRRQLASFIDVHTYGQLWMSPWGYTDAYPVDYQKQQDAMKEIQLAIEQQEGGERYKIGRSATTLYQTSGDALDWVYGRLGLTYTFGIELRPTLAHKRGFRPTRRSIIPTGKDLLAGVTTLARVMMKEKNARKS